MQFGRPSSSLFRRLQFVHHSQLTCSMESTAPASSRGVRRSLAFPRIYWKYNEEMKAARCAKCWSEKIMPSITRKKVLASIFDQLHDTNCCALRITVIRAVTVPTSVSSSGSNIPRDLCRDCEKRGILIPWCSIIRVEKNIAPSLFLSRPRSSPGE